jgi:penicillin-binding protein 1A
MDEVPSQALGTCNASLLELVNAYAVFLNKGYMIKPWYIQKIVDKNNNVLYTAEQRKVYKVMDERIADNITEMLKHVVNNGTALGIKSTYELPGDIAGKTGTTQQHADGWFIGYTPNLITGVWVGGEYPVVRFRSLSLGQGSFTALPIWARFMQKVNNDRDYRDYKYATFQIPYDVKEELKCADYREKAYDSVEDFIEQQGESIVDFIRNIFSRNKNKTQ